MKEEERKRRAAEEDKRAKSRWKSVEDAKEEGLDDQEMADVEGHTLGEGDLDTDVMLDDEGLDGIPMEDSSDEDNPPERQARTSSSPDRTDEGPRPGVTGDASTGESKGVDALHKPSARTKRPTAADMFADESDGE